MNDGAAFGRWLRQRRKILDLSQQELAERVNSAFETVRKIEAGSRRPSRQLAELLGRALAVPEAELATFVEFARAEGAGRALPATVAALTAPPRHVPPSNLPAQRTSFIGRGQDIKQLGALLAQVDVRLVTLLGAPGIGKTRLALALAEAVAPGFADGVCFVSLAPVDQVAGIAPAIARALGLKPAIGRPPLDELKDYLASKELLLLLDNFEQLVAGAAIVGELAEAAGGIKIIVTSRSSLSIYGEQYYQVPPLESPDAEGSLAAWRDCEALQLFTERARAVRPGFVIRDEDVPIVAEIVRQLDGLPLAIELAAARCKVLRPAEILARLGDKLRLLAAGPEDRPPRQRTLAGAVSWSYDLLTPAEQRLLRHMAVFVRSGTFEAIEAVAPLVGVDLLDGLNSLVDKSLLRLAEPPGGEPRFWMLWTIREFAAERLRESDDEAQAQAQHAAYYLQLANAATLHLTSARRWSWLERLEDEHDNMRVALSWSLAAPERAALALKLAGALEWYWYFRSYLAEGRRWLEDALRAAAAAPQSPAPADRARALSAAGWLALLLNECAAVTPLLEPAIDAWRVAGDDLGLAWALARLGAAKVYCEDDARGRPLLHEGLTLLRRQLPDPAAQWAVAFVLDMLGDAELLLGQEDASNALHEESLAAYQELSDAWGIGQQSSELGRTALRRRDYHSAQRLLERAVVLDRAAQHPWNIATTLRSLGDVCLCLGDTTRAGEYYGESLALYREAGDRMRQAAVLRSLGHVARAVSQHELARYYYNRALQMAREAGADEGVAWCLSGLAGLALLLQQGRRAAILFGAATQQAQLTNAKLSPSEQIEYDRYFVLAAAQLDASRLAAGLAVGQALTLDAAVAFALSSLPEPVGVFTAPFSHPGDEKSRVASVIR